MVSSTSSSNTATAFTIPAKAPSSYTAGSDYTVAGGDGYRLTSSTSTPGEISLIANDAEPVTLTLTNGGCSDTGLAFTTLTGTHPQAAGDVTLSAAADGTSATTDITYETGKTAIYIGGTVTVDANTNGESGCSYTVGAAYK
ncbi:hypothetical protein [Aestuariispira insulae]|nr:hypothetical protein [Aestuariispira insulae]